MQGLRRAENRTAALGAEVEQLRAAQARVEREMIAVAIMLAIIAWQLRKQLGKVGEVAAES